ncbi:TauD/TfdA family dioxygenase [Streptomyces gilvosporeus]|uniref:TauD/TfdA family dioxygenase n=1 Tax=Streptomyces gilvosporeus TaxID=553510 RepID=UPI001F3A0910|nr:TauD/TfdA family dioxygenase [Streptomyces gilvosporeus]
MIEGLFVERATDRHVRLRRCLLRDGRQTLATPTGFNRPFRLGAAGELPQRALARLRTQGAVALHSDEPLPARRFIALGARLGRAIVETDPAVLPYVENEVILNLVSRHPETDNIAIQPFADNFLSLHSESSGQPLPRQPRYIVLMCREPGDRRARTVLVPMETVAARLSDRQLTLLSQTRYQQAGAPSAILRRVGNRPVFSFRDFMAQPFAWRYQAADGAGADTVDAAIRALLAAMYAPDAAVGVRWQRGLLVVIDNTFFFHGRTAGPASATHPTTPRRHLQRLRIAEV